MYVFTLQRSLLLAALAVLVTVAFATAHTQSAEAYNFCWDVQIDTGHTCVHGNNHTLISVYGWSVGTAKACAGSKRGPNASDPDYVSLAANCTSLPGATAGTGGIDSCHPVFKSYPAVHNHSTFHSTFEGTFDFGYC